MAVMLKRAGADRIVTYAASALPAVRVGRPVRRSDLANTPPLVTVCARSLILRSATANPRADGSPNASLGSGDLHR